MKQVYIVIQGTVAAFIAWLSAKMGILLPVMGVLMGMMVMDYITGMLASKREAIDHPDDPTYGWCSRRGAEGIIKKVGYLCVIAVAMVVDYLILRVAAEAGFEVATKAFFGLLVAVWYVLNELLSIIENAGRMGAPVPEWLMKYVSVLKNKIDSQGDGTEERQTISLLQIWRDVGSTIYLCLYISIPTQLHRTQRDRKHSRSWNC